LSSAVFSFLADSSAAQRCERTEWFHLVASERCRDLLRFANALPLNDLRRVASGLCGQNPKILERQRVLSRDPAERTFKMNSPAHPVPSTAKRISLELIAVRRRVRRHPGRRGVNLVAELSSLRQPAVSDVGHVRVLAAIGRQNLRLRSICQPRRPFGMMIAIYLSRKALDEIFGASGSEVILIPLQRKVGARC
jgi:hypothetical protein